MELMNNPEFWELWGVVLILVLAAPVVYLLFLVFGSVYLIWKRGGFPDKPQAKMFDPKFGELQPFADRGWEGQFTFPPSEQRVCISNSGESGYPKMSAPVTSEFVQQDSGGHGRVE